MKLDFKDNSLSSKVRRVILLRKREADVTIFTDIHSYNLLLEAWNKRTRTNDKWVFLRLSTLKWHIILKSFIINNGCITIVYRTIF